MVVSEPPRYIVLCEIFFLSCGFDSHTLFINTPYVMKHHVRKNNLAKENLRLLYHFQISCSNLQLRFSTFTPVGLEVLPFIVTLAHYRPIILSNLLI